MPGIINFETFLLTGILLNLSPGNDTIFILSRSIAQGKKAGIMSVLGIGTGSLIHTMLAALGLSVIIGRSILLFNIVRYAGAAYLLFIGLRMVIDRSRLNFNPVITSTAINFTKIYQAAVLTNVLNPKVAMFFIAFLPQFIDPAYRDSVWPFLALGFTFTLTGTAWCLVPAIFSSSLFSGLRKHPSFSSYLTKTCGIVLIGLGIKVAITSRR